MDFDPIPHNPSLAAIALQDVAVRHQMELINKEWRAYADKFADALEESTLTPMLRWMLLRNQTILASGNWKHVISILEVLEPLLLKYGRVRISHQTLSDLLAERDANKGNFSVSARNTVANVMTLLLKAQVIRGVSDSTYSFGSRGNERIVTEAYVYSDRDLAGDGRQRAVDPNAPNWFDRTFAEFHSAFVEDRVSDDPDSYDLTQETDGV